MIAAFNQWAVMRKKAVTIQTNLGGAARCKTRHCE
jgi:hypothetical protein